MKTAIQELIEWIENGTETSVYVIRDKAKELLEKEKEQIVKANIEGTEHGYRESHVFGIDARPYSEKRAEQYYNQKYNQNKL